MTLEKIQIGKIDCVEKKKIVIIGKNGSGKSTELQKLKGIHQNNIFIPSARDVHNMNTALNDSVSLNNAFNQYVSARGYVHNAGTVFISKLISSDYMELCELRDKKEHTSFSKNHIALLNKILKKVSPNYPDVKLENFQIKHTGSYDIKISSDGEKQTIVLICAVLSANKDAIILIDEPENGLHNSALRILFDELEKSRPDCVFVYATHNIDFAKTREDATVIYFSYGQEPKEISNDVFFEKELLIEMNGISKPILLVEGENTDEKLYSKIFRDFEVRSGGGCGEIKSQVNAVRVFFNRDDVFGLIDGDNKAEEKEDELNKVGIFSIPFAQHEHLFILPNVLDIYLTKVGAREKDALSIIIEVIKLASNYERHTDDKKEILKTQAKDIQDNEGVINFLKEYRGKDLVGRVESKIGIKKLQSRMLNNDDVIKSISEFVENVLPKSDKTNTIN